MTYKKIRLILGDQLNENHSWFKENDPETLYVLMEILTETGYVKHHIQKVVGFFLAMQNFSQNLTNQGFATKYFQLNDADNLQSFELNIVELIKKYNINCFEYQLPDEYRLDVELKNLGEKLKNSTEKGIYTEGSPFVVNVVDSEHFLNSRGDLGEMFKGKKTYLMESFYRKARVKYNILMEEDGKSPLTGRWNFDADNRSKLPKTQQIPPPFQRFRDVSEVVNSLKTKGVQTIGRIREDRFDWCVTRQESLDLLDHFCKFRLALFGTYEDAMTQRDTLLFHSKLSFAMNIKLLSPLEVVQKTIHYWETHQDTVSMSQIEGFIRQIIGWREYMRGVYWAQMPNYALLNYFEHKAPLPSWFWTGDTKMNCLSNCINNSLDNAYAHHIQRLMVTGSFSLLLGVSPDELDEWYLGIYMDAIEWVEITNTRGMSQFADGGLVGTKPYVSSANYIDKMSDYCQNCHYDKSKRHGEKACPFNSLYWEFYHRHTDKLAKNPRIGMAYQVMKKMDEEELAKVLAQANYYKMNAETL
jgi:deoxyribodipyrimidine photolyase-related protein